MYKVCNPDEYLVKTGLFIDDMIIGKKTWQFIGQNVTKIKLNPLTYDLKLKNMSSELVPFVLPMVFTVGCVDPTDQPELFKLYAKRVGNKSYKELEVLVEGVIHGETRVLSAQLTVQEMFADREKFKSCVKDKVEIELVKFGLHIYNANIADMHDLEGNNYFQNLKQKALETTGNQARIDIAEAKRIGDIGESERSADALMKIAEIESRKIKEQNINKENITRSKLELDLVQVECEQNIQMKKVEAELAPKELNIKRSTELQLLQAKNKEAELNASLFVESKIRANAAIEKARGDMESKNRETEAELYKVQKNAEALRFQYDAELYKAQQEAEAVKIMADAIKYKTQCEAENILVKTQAVADSFRHYLESGVSEDMIKFYLALENELYTKLADASASAIQGLAPKINVWNTGNSNGTEFSAIKNLAQCIPPIADVLKTQTGITLPFFGNNSNV